MFLKTGIKRLSRAIVALSVATAAIGAPTAAFAENQNLDSAKTVGGQLKVVYSKEELSSRLFLNKKRIVEIEEDNVSIYGIYRVGKEDVALVSGTYVGTAFPFAKNRFLTIFADGRVKVSASFESRDDGPTSVVQDGDVIKVVVVMMDGRRKKTRNYVFADGALKEVK